MDLKHTTTAPAVAGTGSPNTKTDQTPLHSQPINLFSSFPNGNKHHLRPPPTVVAYKECLKNHAAGIGTHAVDGCGEFMPIQTHTPPQPTSLKCAACGCHRNFHRRESTGEFYPTTAAKTHFIKFHHRVATPGTPAAIKLENPNGRKRFRTKFSPDQKEKMSIFAEKVGWKMQRCDDKMVMDLCNEIGIRRRVFKVWMHNNKNTFGKKDKEITTSPAIVAGTGVSFCNKSIDVYNNGGEVSSESHEEDINVDGVDNSNGSHRENGGGGAGAGAVHLQASTNGSSSSS